MRIFFHTIVAGALIVSAGAPVIAQSMPGRSAGNGLIVGMEYALLDNEPLVRGMADAFGLTGMPGMKLMPDAVEWGDMQTRPGGPIDFRRLDWGVRHYQRNGFTELTVGLKSNSRWGSVDAGLFRAGNPAPHPDHLGDYLGWVRSVVERYDGDGVDDMPELRWPVRTYEVGVEFSSYEPEPVAQYLETLALAYRAAHEAFPEVRIAHAAFLTTPVNMDVDRPSDYDEVWRETARHDQSHDLADIRAILDRPDIFDVINLHNLSDPYEIEDQMRWLAWETAQRGYAKPVIISDTLPTSYVGWGPATTCRGASLGVVARPATEADRCRLADYFTRLVQRDAATLAWTREFVAADHVQRAAIAAEQGVERINLAFVADIGFLTWPAARAGAGISAWGGALDISLVGRVRGRYPAFYSVQQLMGHINGYESVERIRGADDRARIYRFERQGEPVWVAWRNPEAALLPEDGAPTLAVSIDTGARSVWIESLQTSDSPPPGDRRRETTRGGVIDAALTHAPIYIYPARDGPRRND